MSTSATHGAWWVWLVAAGLYIVFRLWYDNWRGPLSKDEVEHFMRLAQSSPGPYRQQGIASLSGKGRWRGICDVQSDPAQCPTGCASGDWRDGNFNVADPAILSTLPVDLVAQRRAPDAPITQ